MMRNYCENRVKRSSKRLVLEQLPIGSLVFKLSFDGELEFQKVLLGKSRLSSIRILARSKEHSFGKIGNIILI